MRRKIKVLRSDNRSEYKSDPFLKLCHDEGIDMHFTVRETSQQNGVAEKMNRTLLENIRCMLSNAGLPKNFWVEALAYTCYLVNRLPSSAKGGKTPLEVWSGKAAQDNDSLKVFGCPTYYHFKEDKLDPRAKKRNVRRIQKRIKGYKIWDPRTGSLSSAKMSHSRGFNVEAYNLSEVEIEKIKGISQQVESDATSPILDRTVSVKIIPAVTQGTDHVTDQDTENDEDQ